MLKKTVTFLLVLISAFSFSQEKTKVNEIGIIVYPRLEQFEPVYYGLTFRKGNSNSVWCLKLVNIGVKKNTSSVYNIIEKSCIITVNSSIGKEFRKKIIDNIELRYGLDILYNYDYKSSQIDNYLYNENSIGLNLVWGFNYIIAKKVVFGFEVLPYCLYTKSTGVLDNVTTINEGISYGLTSSCLASLCYRF